MGKVTKSLLVCATPRSGSTLLCALLEGTGVAGRPREFFERLSRSALPRQPREYFEGVDDAELLGLLAPTDPGEPDPGDPIPQALDEGTTGNGVFAARPRRGAGVSVDAPYEAPEAPEFEFDTAAQEGEDAVSRLFDALAV